MKIIGVDFTSAPSRKKPITCMTGIFQEADLSLFLEEVERFSNFEAFETFLNRPDTWTGAFDFPFGLPARFIREMQWPESWEGYVGKIAEMTKADYETALLNYQQQQPTGAKHQFRPTDRLTRSSSPMKLHYPPVGKMFFQGAPRLLRANLDISPCRRSPSSKTALEGYPALLARRFAKSYKSDDKAKQSEAHHHARQEILAGIQSRVLSEEFGLKVILPPSLKQELIDDPTADRLDAGLCAIQAAWAYTRRETGYGIHKGCNPNEGWIIDPALEFIVLS